MQEWLGKVVDREDLTRHDKWCCMMMPRLKLLRELLRNDGAIFVSIDDNEVHRLRCLMDEVFGEENFVTTVVWQKNDGPKNTAAQFSEDHEYLVVYGRNGPKWIPNRLERTEAMIARYKNPDNDPRGNWLLSDLAARNFYAAGRYSITTPKGRIIEGPPAGSYWRVSKAKFDELEKDGRIWWGESGGNRPGIKRFLSEVQEGIVPRTLWLWKDAGSTRHAKQELSQIMAAEAGSDLFVTPKPVSLVEMVARVATEPDSIVLDSFAGSGTTAHAVLALNKEDGGNRRFILVESEDYVDRLTTERVRRVIRGVPKAKDENLRAGLGGTFSYFKLGKPLRLRAILEGSALPDYESLASYVFFTATGEEFDAKKIDKKTWFIGESRHHDVFLLYEQNAERLKQLALTLDVARALPSVSGKPKLVFAPTKYLDPYFLTSLRITFQQLPYQIYKAFET
jgi:adenine-specific DNA-methyltransferase